MYFVSIIFHTHYYIVHQPIQFIRSTSWLACCEIDKVMAQTARLSQACFIQNLLELPFTVNQILFVLGIQQPAYLTLFPPWTTQKAIKRTLIKSFAPRYVSHINLISTFYEHNIHYNLHEQKGLSRPCIYEWLLVVLYSGETPFQVEELWQQVFLYKASICNVFLKKSSFASAILLFKHVALKKNNLNSFSP